MASESAVAPNVEQEVTEEALGSRAESCEEAADENEKAAAGQGDEEEEDQDKDKGEEEEGKEEEEEFVK